VTDYTPYYPPRCGLRVEWYAANSGFHEIPPGYGLRGELQKKSTSCPARVRVRICTRQSATQNANTAVRKAVARSASRSRRPSANRTTFQPGSPPLPPPGKNNLPPNDGNAPDAPASGAPSPRSSSKKNADHATAHVTRALYEQNTASEELPQGDSTTNSLPAPLESRRLLPVSRRFLRWHGAMPANWPDERGLFRSASPSGQRVARIMVRLWRTRRIYSGNDSEFTRLSPATIISATTLASAVGKTTCSAATTSFGSAVTCTSARCSRRAAAPEKRE